MTTDYFDMVVVGSGPSGQKAAVQAAKANKKVAIIEQDTLFGGACVHRGTIPSKTLRENALRVNNMRQHANLANFQLNESMEMSTLIDRLEEVLKAHDQYMSKQIARNNITHIRARAEFVNAKQLKLRFIHGEQQLLEAEYFVIACGSVPRHPAEVPVDHEHIFDSDSILSMLYLPASLTVLGGGVIASEYASIFQALGVKVTIIDKYPRPLGFLDTQLTQKFVHAFVSMGGTWLGEEQVDKVVWNGINAVQCTLASGKIIESEKLLCAAGRVANVEALHIERTGLHLNARGHLAVDANFQTQVAHIYAAGDVIGPPALASTSMEQGRQAACAAFGLGSGRTCGLIPTGIYAIPELSAIGLNEQQAREKHNNIIVATANFEEIARGQISGIEDGLLKLICNHDCQRILGVQIIGEGATELIHIGQMAMLAQFSVQELVETTFNFPTLAEAYRVAALSALKQLTN